jgi:hypothetical protein
LEADISTVNYGDLKFLLWCCVETLTSAPWPGSTRFVIALVRPIVMPTRPHQKDDQGDERNVE